MKSMIRLLVVGLLGTVVVVCAVPCRAQGASEIELTRAEIQVERQALIAANLDLTEEEELGFWPIYRDYRVKMARVGDRLVRLITNYVDNRDALTDTQATEMLREYLAIQSDELAVKRKFVRSFEKVLSAKKVARFYQLENKLDALIRAELAAAIPLVH